MITKQEILMGRDKQYPPTPAQLANLERLLRAVNVVRKAYGLPLIVSSGYRPGHYNKAAGGAKASLHLTLEAVDFKDLDGSFAKWCLANLKVLEEAGLYMENPKYTLGWVHLDLKPRKNRVFTP